MPFCLLMQTHVEHTRTAHTSHINKNTQIQNRKQVNFNANPIYIHIMAEHLT